MNSLALHCSQGKCLLRSSGQQKQQMMPRSAGLQPQVNLKVQAKFAVRLAFS